MPWCPSCEQYLAPPRVRGDGTCPACGKPVEAGGARARSTTDERDGEPISLPWHFKVVAGALALYLGYRAFQGVEWLAGQL